MSPAVIACLDGSAAMRAVCGHGAWAAAKLGRRLGFALPTQDAALDIGTAVLGSDLQRLRQRSLLHELRSLEQRRRSILAGYASALAHGAGEMLGPDTRLDDGAPRVAPLAAILREAMDASLVVLARSLLLRDPEGDTGAAPGSYLAAANVSMLVVDAGDRPLPRKAVVAFDGTLTGRRMVDQFAASGIAQGLHVTLAMALAPTPDGRAQADWAATTLGGACVLERTLLVPGLPAEVITDAVRQSAADLLVLGSYHYANSRQNVAGSTIQQLIECTRVPTLLVR